ncbi:8522_t:CDS:2, partial [Acaulospora morrowiae]
DQFEGFTIPDNSGQLAELLNIIEVMFTFKYNFSAWALRDGIIKILEIVS